MFRSMLSYALVGLSLVICSPALAQNAPSGSPRVQGVPDGYGDPVQVTIVSANGADLSTPLTVGGTTLVNSATFTTPAGTSAYSSGQLIANSATAGSVVPMSITACRVNGGSGMLRRMRLKTPDTGFASGTVTIKLYRDSPTLTNGDHATWLTTESTYIGTVSITLDQHFSDAEKGVGVPSTGSEINYVCASGSTVLYALVVAGGTITPQGSKLFTLTAELLVN